MKVIYVAGPFRGPNAWVVEQNIRRAEKLGFDLAETFEVMPLIPHTNTRFFDGTLTGEFWIEGTLELCKRCDAVFMVPGWECSAGSRGERDWAIANGVPVFETFSELRAWLEESEAA